MKCISYNELYKQAVSQTFYKTIEIWRDNNYLNYILPELASLDNYIHNKEHHPEGCNGDEWGTPLDHTIAAVKEACIRDMNALEKLCVLFHDIGKSVTATGYDKEIQPYHRFFRHDRFGIYVFYDIAKRLNIPDDHTETIVFCIKNHMKVGRLTQITHVSKLEALVLNKDWNILKKVALCDDASRGYAYDPIRYHANIEYAENMVFSKNS